MKFKLGDPVCSLEDVKRMEGKYNIILVPYLTLQLVQKYSLLRGDRFIVNLVSREDFFTVKSLEDAIFNALLADISQMRMPFSART